MEAWSLGNSYSVLPLCWIPLTNHLRWSYVLQHWLTVLWTYSLTLCSRMFGLSFTLCAQSCPAPCDPVDCGPPASTVHGILQARIPEWVVIPYSRGSSPPRDQTCISCIVRQILYYWATWEARVLLYWHINAFGEEKALDSTTELPPFSNLRGYHLGDSLLRITL